MKKKILSTLLALTLSSSMLCSTASAITMYAPDGRTAKVADADVNAWKAVGWYENNYITMYAPDGRTANVLLPDIKAWKAVGWYDFPVAKVYAPDGRSQVIAKSDVDAWVKVGWYKSKSITMYAPDGRTANVMLADIAAWKAVGWYEKPVTVYYTPTPSYTKGTLNNPYSPLSGASISYSEWSWDPQRKVSIKCVSVLRGSVANSIVHSENMFNDTPNSNQEWCLLEFDIKYISSTDGYDDVLEASDIIYRDTFFTSTGSSINVADMATLSHDLEGYGVFDVEFYPGSSGKVIIGLLINKNVGDILLRVPNKLQNTNSWISCK